MRTYAVMFMEEACGFVKVKGSQHSAAGGFLVVGPVSVWPGRIMRLLSQDSSYYTTAKGPSQSKGRSANRGNFTT